MNLIDYSPYTFDDSSIISGSTAEEIALMQDSLNPDELTVEVISNDTGNGKLYTVLMEWYHTVDGRGYVIAGNDLRKFTYGDPVLYYYNGVLQGKYYIKSVERLSKNRFKLSAISAVGMWASIQHMGGIYDGETVGDVVKEMLVGNPYNTNTMPTGTRYGVTYTNNGDGTWTLNGTANNTGGIVNYSLWQIYDNNRAFPTGMGAGKSYYATLNNGGSTVNARIYYTKVYEGGTASAFEVAYMTSKSTTGFVIPADAVGLIVRLEVPNGITVDNAVCSVSITDTPPVGQDYQIDPDVASVPLYGWLPIASVRDNLQQVLFAVGANLAKDASGNPHIKYLDDLTALPVSGDRIYIGGKLSYKTPSTKVTITEHSYYISSYDVEVSLFDNTDGSGTATNKLVTFNEPCHDLMWNGAAIDSSWSHGANYCYVTGSGVLTGKKYTHTQKVFSVPTGVEGEPKESKVEKATLVSAVNSANVAARVSDYMATAEEVACGIVMEQDDIKPGSLISFTDPYDDETEGLVSKMHITMSGKSKAEATIVKNYTPGHFGNNFENYDLITSETPSGTWDAPKTGTIRIVLCQGGQGGQGGQNGTSGNGNQIAGAGGSGGVGGIAGKVFVTDITVTQGQTFSYSVGFGGPGGVIKGEGEEGYMGFEGSHTTFGSYTSANGASPLNGYSNILTGETYAENGKTGVQGGNGGLQDYGQDVTYEGQTWTGGWPLGSGYDRAGGGGAAYGENGHYAYSTASGMHGGAGANAQPLPIVASLGSGGAGGNGGGGGGSGTRLSSTNGEYGEGCTGNTGGDGFIIIYY